MKHIKAYEEWINSKVVSDKLKNELKGLSDEEIYDRFYKKLEFGTGGIRGVMGAGTNRMNEVTVSLATQGFANYINDKFDKPSVVIAYDSRNNSKEFAKITALTFAASGIKSYLYKTLEPTPILSYSLRKLKCVGGVVVTASHNKKEYNGYKIYDEFGGQITDTNANKVIDYVNEIEGFDLIKKIDEKVAMEKGLFSYIDDNLLDTYFEKVKNLVIRKDLVKENATKLSIVYTPLHGAGNIPVRRVLKELGYNDIMVVKEQELPDGNFSTLVYPNPEDPNAFKLAVELGRLRNADIIFGTDPDCDRIGLVAKAKDGKYKVLTGNETGILLTEYILRSLNEINGISKDSYMVKTIVSTNAVNGIAKKYNVDIIEVLTGFKYIAEQIRELSDLKGRKYLFGFEESYGYLAGDFVRDKDAVIGSVLAMEMALYYKMQGKSIFEALDDIYEKYGYFKESLVSIESTGQEGVKKIENCMKELRNLKINSIFNKKIKEKYDYKNGLTLKNITLPKSNVLRFDLENDYSFIVRPSGTEPKIKIYFSVKEDSKLDAERNMDAFKEEVMKVINKFLV
ncbi:phospho-sugar mutase [uncultured Clostridium sp.]|uniref:phospho-sugar mutase n=1 Tax=uncultured Clostridium sp. TaxID=59620 RepID=UPI00261CAC20|nr:phospho-sugar mutase [uncultured Clostridium sp.]